MALIINEEIIQFLFSSFISFIVALICLYQVYKKNRTPLLFFGLKQIFEALCFLFTSLGDMFLNPIYRNISSVFFVISVLCMVIFFDYALNEKVSSYKLAIWSALSVFYLYVDLQPDSYIITADEVSRRALPNFALLLLTIFLVIIILWWNFLVNINSPKNLKKYSIMLIASLPVSLMISGFLSLLNILTGNLMPTILNIYMIIIVIILIKEPLLLYVLPFKAYKLLVIKKESGIMIYDYKWAKDNIDDDLITGLITALQDMGNEVLDRGMIKEIILEHGSLIFCFGEWINVCLITSKISKSLRESLNNFSSNFEVRFFNEINSQSVIFENFKDADELIDRFFSNVPVRND